MDISTTENLKTVRDSNQEILDYFNELYVEKLEQIQAPLYLLRGFVVSIVPYSSRSLSNVS